MTPNIRNTCGEPVTVPDEISIFKLPVRLILCASSKVCFTASQLLFGAFALCNVLRKRHYESRYPLGARHKRNVVAYPNRTAVLAAILFLDLKLSSFSFHQLGDERPVGLAVVLMR